MSKLVRLNACIAYGSVGAITYGMAPLTALSYLPVIAFEPINETIQSGVQATLSSQAGGESGYLTDKSLLGQQ